MSDLSNDVRTKVLIAEDDAIVALDLQGMVMRLGFDVVAITENGQTAIAAARRFQPDVLLLEMSLPGGMDGIEVAKEVHKYLDIPIVFCVASPDLSILARAKDISYAGYLLKPINPDSLATTLDTVLYKYKLAKRVEIAETKFRKLTETNEVLDFFFDSDASLKWSWNPESGVSLDAESPMGGIAIAELSRAIDSAVRAFAESPARASGGTRIARLLELPDSSGIAAPFALIGILDPQTGNVSGMLVPLERSGA